ncbi:hypothetical protein [Kytococcus sp. Marseille-QA3725]
MSEQREAGTTETRHVDPEKVQLPPEVRVRTGPWLLALVIAVVLWVPVLMATFGAPASLFRDPSPGLSRHQWMAALCLVPTSVHLAHAWMGWRHPRHLTIDEDGIETYSWRVEWSEVASIWPNPPGGGAPDRQTNVGFMGHRRAWTDELRRGNRWDSGYPFELGGMLPQAGTITTQFATNPPIESLVTLFERLRAKAHGEDTGDQDEPEA